MFAIHCNIPEWENNRFFTFSAVKLFDLIFLCVATVWLDFDSRKYKKNLLFSRTGFSAEKKTHKFAAGAIEPQLSINNDVKLFHVK